MKNYKNVSVKVVEVNDVTTISRQEGYDFVINTYTGCPFACSYCYASFMKRFSKHSEPWGDFLDVKQWKNPLNAKKLEGKKILISSVTDPYNPFEEEYKVTRKALKELSKIDCKVTINTKSPLVVRDIDLFKKMKDVNIALSLCTLDQNLANDLEAGISIQERLDALKKLHKSKIKTTLIIAPILPELTDWKAIINATNKYVDEYHFEGLTLRNEYKPVIINYIWKNYHNLYPQYLVLYKGEPENYWVDLANEIDEFCQTNGINYINNINKEEKEKEFKFFR